MCILISENSYNFNIYWIIKKINFYIILILFLKIKKDYILY